MKVCFKDDTCLKYLAPMGESAMFKNVPMSERDAGWVRLLTRGKRGFVRYRGPRHTANAQHTLKEDAVAFSIYTKVEISFL